MSHTLHTTASRVHCFVSRFYQATYIHVIGKSECQTPQVGTKDIKGIMPDLEGCLSIETDLTGYAILSLSFACEIGSSITCVNLALDIDGVPSP